MTSTFAYNDLEIIGNRTFDEIAVGDCASIQRTLTAADIQLFAAMSGDVNPTHIDPEFAAATRFHGVIAHGMWGAALISAVLGTRLPGPGTIYLGQTLTFHTPVHVGDALTITVTVTTRDEAKHRFTLDCTCVNQEGKTVISGEATVMAPTERIDRPRGTLPQVRIALSHGDELVRLLQYVKPLGRLKMAVVHPCDEVSLSAAMDAQAAGLIEPVLLGPRDRIEAVAQKAGINLAGVAIEDYPHSHAAAARAVELALKGDVEALMKGSLHTDELMGAVVKSALRGERRHRRRRPRAHRAHEPCGYARGAHRLVRRRARCRQALGTASSHHCNGARALRGHSLTPPNLFAGSRMTLNPDSKYPSRRAYVLKLRSDAQPGALAGRLENVITGRQHEFSSGLELLDSLTGDLAATADDTTRK